MPYGVEGELLTSSGPQLTDPPFRFGVERRSKLRAVNDLKRSLINRAAAAHTPIDLPTWGHFAAAFRTFEGAKVGGRLLFEAAFNYLRTD